jgi:phage protein U
MDDDDGVGWRLSRQWDTDDSDEQTRNEDSRIESHGVAYPENVGEHHTSALSMTSKAGAQPRYNLRACGACHRIATRPV